MKLIARLFFMLCLFTLAGCKEFEEVKVSGVKGFKLTKMSMEGAEAEIILGVKNPNSVGFNIYPSEFDVTFSGIYLGKAKLYKKVKIGANSEGDYTFLLKSNFKEVNVTDLTRLMGGKSAGTVEVKGDLKAGKLLYKKLFPVNVKERINLQR